MKKANTLSRRHSSAPSQKDPKGMLALAALLLCGLAIPSAAETTINEVAREQGFTIPVNLSTPIVTKTSPDAICDLHAEGDDSLDRSMTVYANTDGYVKFHSTARQESDEGQRIQLDCTDPNGKVTRYPLHLRVASSPTAAMPAPLSKAPVPKGSTILPALTEEEQQTLSNDELIDRGYSERPDAARAPEKYSFWREEVSRPMTVLPSHQADSGKSHHPVTADTENDAWSGYMSYSPYGDDAYSAVAANWHVPAIVSYYGGGVTMSSFWVGLDGYQVEDLVQAGTEQDSVDLGQTQHCSYTAWTELLPNQLTDQTISNLQPDPGDWVGVEVWMSTGSGAPNVNGQFAAFRVVDSTLNQSSGTIYTPLGSTFYHGVQAEWIMERPCIGLQNETCISFPFFSDYDYANMVDPGALNASDEWFPYSELPGLTQLWLYNKDYIGDDNNQLSGAYNHGSTDINFVWYNFH